MQTIVVNRIPFQFVRVASGAFILIDSDYCEEELLEFIKENLDEEITKTPILISTIEVLIKKFNGEKV